MTLRSRQKAAWGAEGLDFPASHCVLFLGHLLVSDLFSLDHQVDQ